MSAHRQGNNAVALLLCEFAYAFAFATNNDREITLTAKGRYLTVVMMRQFFIGVNNLRDQARAALTGEERQLIFGE